MSELHKQTRQIRKFNPGAFQSDEEVINQFVVRKRELAVVLEILRNNANSQSCQHVLLVAPRGRGKTMMLARVAAELRTDGDLTEQLLPVRFMEESQEIFNLGDFWLETLFYLAREEVNDPDLTSELRDVHTALAAGFRGSELEQRARAAVLNTVDRLGKKLVLMVENLQTLCKDVDDDFGWKLRKVLQSEPQIILLATATSHFVELDDTEHAFFELFRIVRLEALDTDECRLLWQMVTGVEVRKGVIRPLQILTGGDPRLLVIIGEFAQHQSLRQLMEDLVRLIDDHTEYFRAHLEGIGKTERRAYLALIDLWQPSTTGEIAARARLDVRTVSTMLGRLVERGAIVVEGNGRKRYAAAQRLYSIYYKLRRERDEAAVVRNLVHFMVVFYSGDELSGMAGRLIWEAEHSPTIRDGIKRAIQEAPQIGRIFSEEEWLTISQTTERAPIPGIQISPNTLEQDRLQVLWQKAVEHLTLGEFEAAISIFDHLVASTSGGDASEIHARVAAALVNKGVAQGQLGDAQAEMDTYDEVVVRFRDSATPEIQVWVTRALVNKGITQGQLQDARAEMATYDEVVGRFGDSDEPEVQACIASALVNKGVAQGQNGDAQAAIATYDEVVGRFGNSDLLEIQARVASALVNKGAMQGQIGDAQAAMATYDEVVERFGDSDLSDLQVWAAIALANKGATLIRLGDTQAAMATCDEVVVRFGDSDAPEMQAWVAAALVNKGATLFQLGDTQAAMTTYDDLVGRFGDSDAPEIQLLVAKSLVNKADTEVRLGCVEGALHSCEEIEQRCSVLADIEKDTLERHSRWIRTRALLLLGQDTAAMDLFRSIYSKFVPSEETMVVEVMEQVPKLIAAGASVRDLIAVLTIDSEKADKLLPLVVALRQLSGEVVRAPAEVMEIATDIQKVIESNLRPSDDVT